VRQLIVAFNDQQAAGTIRQVLLRHGLPVASACQSGAQVLQQASLTDGGVVICPYRLVDMTARELLHLLSDSFDLLLLVPPRQQGMLVDPGLYALTWPAQSQQLVQAARQLLETRQLNLGRQPAHAARTAQEQKVIEQAKYLLMNRRHCSEDEAHRMLQQKSMALGLRLAETALLLIDPDRAAAIEKDRRTR